MSENIEKLHERLYKCRDLEISNLWQRSVFLSVFLILCFTAYGYLIIEMINIYTSGNDYETSVIIYNFACTALGGVAFIFSCIWIAMAKGSKAWYEVYESRITNFEKEHQLQLGIPVGYRMGDFSNDDERMNNSLFSTKAGGYSVSRINIAIGQISYVIWSIIIISHFIGNVILIPIVACNTGLTPIQTIILFASVSVVVVAKVIELIITEKDWIRSTHL